MRALSIPGLILIAVMVLSCSDDDTQTPEVVPLEETTWRLVRFELTGGSLWADDGQELWLQLGAETDGQRIAHARADCNECGGPYTLGPNDSISLELGCTEMYCGDESQGGLFAEAAGRTTSYSHDNSSLRLNFSNGEETGSLIFTAETD